jgi:cytochrome b pre-mRNA-processing protein 3
MKVMGILDFFGLKQYDDSVYKLYGQIVAQARDMSFYRHFGVADTVNGRFDLITLHMFIVLRRLKNFDEGGGLSQDLFDVMFADMDKNMREMGIGDLRVGKKVRALAVAFYGRIKAYDDGIAGLEGATLIGAMKRNLFLDSESSDAQVIKIADYVMQEIVSSQKWSFTNLKVANISFGTVPE